MKLDSFDKAMIGVIAAFLILLAISVVLVMHLGGKFDRSCIAAGGHTKSLYRTTLCITPDGRIIDL